jgi:hypothetical protein
MKTVLCYLLGIVWVAVWFCSCGTPSGGDTTVSVDVNQSQNQPPGFASSSEETDPCLLCTGTLSEITECLELAGMEPSDCAE